MSGVRLVGVGALCIAGIGYSLMGEWTATAVAHGFMWYLIATGDKGVA